jgi:hypothetical protein
MLASKSPFSHPCTHFMQVTVPHLNLKRKIGLSYTSPVGKSLTILCINMMACAKGWRQWDLMQSEHDNQFTSVPTFDKLILRYAIAMVCQLIHKASTTQAISTRLNSHQRYFHPLRYHIVLRGLSCYHPMRHGVPWRLGSPYFHPLCYGTHQSPRISTPCVTRLTKPTSDSNNKFLTLYASRDLPKLIINHRMSYNMPTISQTSHKRSQVVNPSQVASYWPFKQVNY